jgi:hypothetical protein
MDIWNFQKLLTGRLLSWAGMSVTAGTALYSQKDPFSKGIGVQFISWGVINAAIALFGYMSANRSLTSLPDPNAEDVQTGEKGKLSRILWFNTGLDVLYIIGGVLLFAKGRKSNHQMRGHGIGIVIQGAFLFFFDLIHAARLGRN